VDLQTLRFFRAVARSGSISGTARDMNYAQSNLTARIRQLEADLGTRLFYRHNRGTTLTDKGRVLLAYAEKILQLVEEAQHVMRDDETPRGPLAIGSMETTAAVRLPNLLARFHRLYPGVALALKTGPTRQNIEDVLNHELDGAFVAGPVEHPGLRFTTAFEEELVLVTDPSAGLLSSAKALRDRTILVFHSGCSYRARFEDWLRHEGIVPEKVMEFGTLDGIIGCAAAGLGVALLPRSTVEKHVRDHLVAGHPIPDPFGKVQTVFIYRNEEYLPTPLKKMIELLNDGQRTDGGIAHGHGTG